MMRGSTLSDISDAGSDADFAARRRVPPIELEMAQMGRRNPEVSPSAAATNERRDARTDKNPARKSAWALPPMPSIFQAARKQPADHGATQGPAQVVLKVGETADAKVKAVILERFLALSGVVNVAFEDTLIIVTARTPTIANDAAFLGELMSIFREQGQSVSLVSDGATALAPAVVDPEAKAAADAESGLLKAPPAMMMMELEPPKLGAHGRHSSSRVIQPATKLYGELHFGQPSCCCCCCSFTGWTCLPEYARKRTFVKVYDNHVHENLAIGCLCCHGESDAIDRGGVTFHDTWERVEKKLCCGCGKRQIYVKKRPRCGCDIGNVFCGCCRGGEDIMISNPLCCVCCACLCNWVDVCPCDFCSFPMYGDVTNGTEFLTQWQAAAEAYKVRHSFAPPKFLGLPKETAEEAKALTGAKVGGEEARAFGWGTSEFVQSEDRFEAAVEFDDFAPCDLNCCSSCVHDDIKQRMSFQLFDNHVLRTQPLSPFLGGCCYCPATTLTGTGTMFHDRLAPGAQPGWQGSWSRMCGPPVVFVEHASCCCMDLRPVVGETIRVAPYDFGGCRQYICCGKPLWTVCAYDGVTSVRNGEDFLASWQKVMNAYSDKHGISAEHRPHFELEAVKNCVAIDRLEISVMRWGINAAPTVAAVAVPAAGCLSVILSLALIL